jgi:hypothetical protein
MDFTAVEVYKKINKMEAIVRIEKSWVSVRTNLGEKMPFNKLMSRFRAEILIR